MTDEHARTIGELRGWIAELETAKAWLDEQRHNWLAIAGERERVIQQQQAYIASLERTRDTVGQQSGS